MTTTYVLLIDDNDATALVACPSLPDAERLASTAVFSDGGVSAYLVPDKALTDWERVREILREGGNCETIGDAELPEAAREAGR